MQHNVLYIHGFNSSPLSIKAEQTRRYFAKYFPDVTFHCPQLKNNPIQALAQLEVIISQSSEQDGTFIENKTVKTKQRWSLIGSSLGGYFSHYFANKYQLRAALINPAVKPYELLSDYLGEQTNPYTGEVFHIDQSYVQQLKNIEQLAPKIDAKEKNNYLVMVQTHDEVLDYQQAVDKFQHCRLVLQQGGDHSFVDFDKMLPTIADFFQLE